MQPRTIAEKLMEIYLRHVGSLNNGDRVIELKKITRNRATVIQFVNAFLIACGKSKTVPDNFLKFFVDFTTPFVYLLNIRS